MPQWCALGEHAWQAEHLHAKVDGRQHVAATLCSASRPPVRRPPCQACCATTRTACTSCAARRPSSSAACTPATRRRCVTSCSPQAGKRSADAACAQAVQRALGSSRAMPCQQLGCRVPGCRLGRHGCFRVRSIRGGCSSSSCRCPAGDACQYAHAVGDLRRQAAIRCGRQACPFGQL